MKPIPNTSAVHRPLPTRIALANRHAQKRRASLNQIRAELTWIQKASSQEKQISPDSPPQT